MILEEFRKLLKVQRVEYATAQPLGLKELPEVGGAGVDKRRRFEENFKQGPGEVVEAVLEVEQ